MSCLSVSCKWIKTRYILITWFNVQNNSLRLALVLINISDLDLANCPSSVNIRVSKYGWFNNMPTLFWSFYIFLSFLLYSWDRLKNCSLSDLHDSLFGTASSKRSFVQCYRGPYILLIFSLPEIIIGIYIKINVMSTELGLNISAGVSC